MRRLIVFTLLALTACTPQQTAAWLDWFDADPRAATVFARQDWDQDGVIEPEPSAEAADVSADTWTDRTTTETESGVGVYWPWDELAECESNGNWSISTGNGYYGGLQFSLGSWQSVGGSGYPHEASPAEQVRRGELLQDAQGWSAWPTCSRIIGLL